MTQKKALIDEVEDAVRPHMEALIEICEQYNLPCIVGIDVSAVAGESDTVMMSMYAHGPVCAALGIAIDALDEDTPPGVLMAIAALLNRARVGRWVTDGKVGNA